MVCLSFVPLLASGQDTLTVMSYNLLDYNSTSAQSRNQYFRTVIRHVKPDVLAVGEITSQAAVDSFFSTVLNVVFPGQFSKGIFIDGPDTDNEIYYKTSRFTFVSNTPIHTALRNISEFKLYSVTAADTLRVYSVHLKASQGSEFEADRGAEVDSLRRVTNALPAGKYFMVVGDYNIYTATETAYQKLLNPPDNGKFVDALTMPGTWHQNASYAVYHTQSTRISDLGDGGATAGLDDRFDMILFSTAVSQPGRIRYLLNSLTPVGNDGNHYRDSINHLPNTAVPDSVANALYRASDHLPVTARFVFSPGSPVNFTITASAGPHGSINPTGVVTVTSGANQTFVMSSNTGYHVDSVIVDGSMVGSPPTYTFNNVQSNHTIRAVFAINRYSIVSSAGPNGSIVPSGTLTVDYGANQQYAISPAQGYHVDTLLVDGLRVDSTVSYTFINVAANHAIRAVFSINRYTITATADSHGTISPSGNISVPSGGTQMFVIAPQTGYHVDSVLVDGVRVDSLIHFTFTNVVSAHQIHACFGANQYTITASSGPHGTIQPGGEVVVTFGSGLTFAAHPDSGYTVDSLLVDDVQMPAAATYEFTNVSADHTIRMTFKEGSQVLYEVNEGWNLLSLPLSVSDGRKVVLFPSALGPAFAYEAGRGYVVRDTLANGPGYWLKFPPQQSILVTGDARLADTMDVVPGWNLIGSISTAVPVTSIEQDPPSIIVSPFFRYAARYIVSDTVRPALGYWVKVNGNGRLILR